MYYKHADFVNTAGNYNKAFSDNNDLGKANDRYKLACCYSMLNKPDSAFLQLKRIVNKGRYANIDQIEAEPYLNALHQDKRWETIIGMVNKNKSDFRDEMNRKMKENREQK
jgi:hypothetical protein